MVFGEILILIVKFVGIFFKSVVRRYFDLVLMFKICNGGCVLVNWLFFKRLRIFLIIVLVFGWGIKMDVFINNVWF